MEKNSKGNKDKKKDKADKTLVVHSETQIHNAILDKTPFKLGPSLTSIKWPIDYEVEPSPLLFIKSLQDNTTLTSLTLHRTASTWNKTVMDAFEKSLTANTSIHTLEFSYVSFDQTNAKFIKSLAKILTKNHRIQHIRFFSIDDRMNYNIFDPFCQSIHLFGLKSLSIKDLCHTHTIALCTSAAKSPTLTTLSVDFTHQSPQVFNSMVDALIENPKITDLTVGSSQGEIAGDRWLNFKPVLERDTLRRLIFNYLNLKDNVAVQENFNNVVSVLQRSKNLEEFGVIFGGNLSWKFVGDIVSNNKNIKKLVLDGSYFLPEQFVDLKLDQNESLTELSFDNCYQAGNYLGEILSHNTTIKKLKFGTRHLTNNEINALSRALKKNWTLTDLQVLGEYSESPIVDLFSEVLSVNTGLRKLTFTIQFCNYESACRLIDALKINTTLRELNLEKTAVFYIGSHTKPSGAPTFDLLLADLLHTNQSLTFIQGSEDFPEIQAALKRNKENQLRLVTNGKMFVKMLVMRPRAYGGILPPEVWCMILRHVTVPGIDWDAEQFYRQNL